MLREDSKLSTLIGNNSNQEEKDDPIQILEKYRVNERNMLILKSDIKAQYQRPGSNDLRDFDQQIMR
jgi:hypothetical protein